jgi:Clp amino terminal domain, pathogenicity island component
VSAGSCRTCPSCPNHVSVVSAGHVPLRSNARLQDLRPAWSRDLSSSWGGSPDPAAYAILLKASYRSIKAVDPQCRCHLRCRERAMAGPNQQFDREHVLQFSEGDAQRLAGDYIGTEHLLLGLLRHSEGLAARVLRASVSRMSSCDPSWLCWSVADRLAAAGLSASGIDQRVNVMRRTLLASSRCWVPSNGACAVAERSSLPWKRLVHICHQQVGNGHLLLDLLREGEGMATGSLASLGVDDLEGQRAHRAKPGARSCVTTPTISGLLM